MDVSLEFHRVTKIYGRRRVFTEISAQAAGGQALVVTGPNGSGKSTLLKILCGLTAPTRGEVRVRIDGQEWHGAHRRQGIGYASPEFTLYEELTALENLEFFARVRGVPGTRAEWQAWLARVGLGGRGGDPVGAFSSGMKQRLKLAYALLHRPPVLVLDEPGTNLDEAGRRLVAELVAEQRQRGLVVLATNDPQEAELGDVYLRLGGSGRGGAAEGPAR